MARVCTRCRSMHPMRDRGPKNEHWPPNKASRYATVHMRAETGTSACAWKAQTRACEARRYLSHCAAAQIRRHCALGKLCTARSVPRSPGSTRKRCRLRSDWYLHAAHAGRLHWLRHQLHSHPPSPVPCVYTGDCSDRLLGGSDMQAAEQRSRAGAIHPRMPQFLLHEEPGSEASNLANYFNRPVSKITTRSHSLGAAIWLVTALCSCCTRWERIVQLH